MAHAAVLGTVRPCTLLPVAVDAALMVSFKPGRNGEFLGVEMTGGAGRISRSVLGHAVAARAPLELPSKHLFVATRAPIVDGIAQGRHALSRLGPVAFSTGSGLGLDGGVVVTVQAA